MRGSKCQVEGTTRLFCEERWPKKVSHWEIRKRASWHVHGWVHALTSLGRCYLPAQFLLHLISWVQNVQSPCQVHILPMIVSSTFYIWHIPYVCPLTWTLVGYLQIAFVSLTWLGRLTNMFLASSILISMIIILDNWDHFLWWRAVPEQWEPVMKRHPPIPVLTLKRSHQLQYVGGNRMNRGKSVKKLLHEASGWEQWPTLK